MKGVIYSTSFFILIFVVFLNLTSYINFDHNRSIINNNFKKSLVQTAYLLKDKNEVIEEEILELLLENLEPSLPDSFDYNFELLGYHEDPLLLRIKLRCFSKSSIMELTLEETLLEKELEDV